ncbi:hypothetical protein DFH09DRAFT_1441156 [Mycena vulgaris]|nr:hypothetical protein DFH09DRAFT_1441156 [Mycena vulgaris]
MAVDSYLIHRRFFKNLPESPVETLFGALGHLGYQLHSGSPCMEFTLAVHGNSVRSDFRHHISSNLASKLSTSTNILAAIPPSPSMRQSAHNQSIPPNEPNCRLDLHFIGVLELTVPPLYRFIPKLIIFETQEYFVLSTSLALHWLSRLLGTDVHDIKVIFPASTVAIATTPAVLQTEPMVFSLLDKLTHSNRLWLSDRLYERTTLTGPWLSDRLYERYFDLRELSAPLSDIFRKQSLVLKTRPIGFPLSERLNAVDTDLWWTRTLPSLELCSHPIRRSISTANLVFILVLNPSHRGDADSAAVVYPRPTLGFSLSTYLFHNTMWFISLHPSGSGLNSGVYVPQPNPETMHTPSVSKPFHQLCDGRQYRRNPSRPELSERLYAGYRDFIGQSMPIPRHNLWPFHSRSSGKKSAAIQPSERLFARYSGFLVLSAPLSEKRDVWLSCSIEREAGRRFRSKIRGRARLQGKLGGGSDPRSEDESSSKQTKVITTQRSRVRFSSGLTPASMHLQLRKHRRASTAGPRAEDAAVRASTGPYSRLAHSPTSRSRGTRRQRCCVRDRLARFAARHGQYMCHTRASACPHLAFAEYEDLARSPHRPRCAPLRTCTPERRVRVVHRASARSRCCPRAALAARLPARAALLVLAPPPPCALTPRVRPVHHIPASTGTAHPRARDTFLPRWLRTHTPERRARGSLTTSTAASPRVRGLGASPRALGAALLLALAPRTPRARRPPREREGSVQRPVVLASFALSPRSPSYLHPIRAPRSPNPREYVSPRAHLHGICRLPAPRTPPSPHPREYGDTMPPRARSPHRPRRTAPRTCTPVRAQGVAAALASSHLDPPNAARARGVGRWLRTRLVARESSCSRGRRSRPASVYLDDTRRISARVSARAEAGTERCAVQETTSACIPLGAAAPSTRAEKGRGAGC